MLSHELCAYPASFIDQYGDLRQGNKSLLTAKLAIYITDQPVPDVENGTVSVVAESIGSRLRNGTTISHHMQNPTKLLCVRIVTLLVLPRVMSARVLVLPPHMSLGSRQHSSHENKS